MPHVRFKKILNCDKCTIFEPWFFWWNAMCFINVYDLTRHLPSSRIWRGWLARNSPSSRIWRGWVDWQGILLLPASKRGLGWLASYPHPSEEVDWPQWSVGGIFDLCIFVVKFTTDVCMPGQFSEMKCMPGPKLVHPPWLGVIPMRRAGGILELSKILSICTADLELLK